MKRIFLHTLSLPEHIWLTFFREFFSQKVLVWDPATQAPLKNNFYIDLTIPEDNRPFDVHLAFDYSKANNSALPALVIEDTGAVQTGLTMDQRRTFSVSPQTVRDRADAIRHTYIFHCLSKNRGESRLLASIVARAIVVFREPILKNDGMIKIEPWDMGATQPLKSDSEEEYCDTPVRVTFYTMDYWNTLELGVGTAQTLKIEFAPSERQRFVRSFMEVADSDARRFVRSFMLVANPNLQRFVRSSVELENPLMLERFIRSSMATENPLSANRFIRSSMRVS